MHAKLKAVVMPGQLHKNPLGLPCRDRALHQMQKVLAMKK